MYKKTVLISGLVALIISLSVVLAAGIVFYFLSVGNKQTIVMKEPTDSENSNIESNFAEDTPTPTPKKLEIQTTDISSISFRTSYKWYLEENTDCEKKYRELLAKKKNEKEAIFGCRNFSLIFKRDGTAVKQLTFADDSQELWQTKITKNEFEQLAKSISESNVFINWHDGLSMTTANTTIWIEHSKGNRQLMSNVDSTTTNFLSLMGLFKKLDNNLRPKWQKCKVKDNCQDL